MARAARGWAVLAAAPWAELGAGALFLVGWASLTAGVVGLVGRRELWWISGGLLALSLFGWRVALVIARDGLYALSQEGRERRRR